MKYLLTLAGYRLYWLLTLFFLVVTISSCGGGGSNGDTNGTNKLAAPSNF